MTQPVSTAHLIANMQDARNRTLELIQDLDDQQLMGPKIRTVNPLKWEIAHTAYFYEFFILRQLYGHDSVIGDRADELYDSINIHHDVRWDLPLPDRQGTLAYMQAVFDRLSERLVGSRNGGMASEQDSFIYQFGIFHEDMHTEAYLWARQTLAYPTPNLAVAADVSAERAAGGHPGWAMVPGGRITLGADRSAPFLFDNEKWAHEVVIAPFEIAMAPVTNGEFQAFVDSGGYETEPTGIRTAGPGVWRQMPSIPFIGSPTVPAIGCSDGSKRFCLYRSMRLSFTSTGTRPTPIAAGPDYAFRRKRNGRPPPWARRVPTATWRPSSGTTHGARRYPTRVGPTWMAGPWGPSTSRHFPLVTARLAAGKCWVMSGNGRRIHFKPSQVFQPTPTRNIPPCCSVPPKFCGAGRGQRAAA